MVYLCEVFRKPDLPSRSRLWQSSRDGQSVQLLQPIKKLDLSLFSEDVDDDFLQHVQRRGSGNGLIHDVSTELTDGDGQLPDGCRHPVELVATDEPTCHDVLDFCDYHQRTNADLPSQATSIDTGYQSNFLHETCGGISSQEPSCIGHANAPLSVGDCGQDMSFDYSPGLFDSHIVAGTKSAVDGTCFDVGDDLESRKMVGGTCLNGASGVKSAAAGDDVSSVTALNIIQIPTSFC